MMGRNMLKRSLPCEKVKLPKNILIIVPHSDDEVLMCGGLIYRALREKSRVSVAVVTNGDYLCCDEQKGSKRLEESMVALKMLGMQEKDVYFFGYPDTGMECEVSFLYNLYEEKDFMKVHSTKRGNYTYGVIGGKQDFAFERTGSHALYTKHNFLEDLKALLGRVQPELVITTSEWDLHGDHQALLRFVRDELIHMTKEAENCPALWQGLIHSPAGDEVWPIPDTPGETFSMPPGLEDMTDLIWQERIRIPLPEQMKGQTLEEDIKYQAIWTYRSVLKETEEPEVVRYLLAFSKTEEIFWNVKY